MKSFNNIRPAQRFRLTGVIAVLLLLMACHDTSPLGRLGGIDSLVNARPDSALTLLNSIARDTAEMSRRDLMRYYLLRTNAENKCDTVLTARHAALMLRVCDYYDRHSSPRGGREGAMLAHYLLGRCYSDMGEAPAALREFGNAIQQADTTRADCDFILLSNIYYQNAHLLLYQMVLPEAINSYRKAEAAAYRGRDTLRALSCLEHTTSAYYMMNEYDSVLSVCNHVMHEYRKCGNSRAYYNVIPVMAQVLTQQGKTRKAGELFKEYEARSGLFGTGGEIEKGREAYYSMKGDYLLSAGDYESAKLYYMKLMQIGGNLNRTEAAAKGLFEVYQKLQVPDSISKYARLYCQANDSAYRHTYTKEMVRSKAMYDYSRLERAANDKSLEAERHKNLVYLLVVILSLMATISTVVYIISWKARKQKVFEFARMNLQYSTLLNQFNETTLRIERLQAEAREETVKMAEKYRVSQKNMSDIKNRYEKEIGRYKKEIDDLNVQLSKFRDAGSLGTPIHNGEPLHYVVVNRLHQMAGKMETPSEKDWNDLENIVSKHHSPFYSYITDPDKALSILEKRVAILIRLGFIVSECCILLKSSSQSLSNARGRINRKLFNGKGATGLDNSIMSL